ncbi:oxepin-CoA hydrolase, alternative type [Castellaniella caeni]|uniref:oxepin-CoA hydrolase, alternative type n=1 Tax=Castellaniella caeni TaxID=266123 RepID=UPI00082ECB41|nr:enoyl-CoA hydratase [Castellaniella caeni]
MSERLVSRREGAVQVLVNHNPQARNALSPEFYSALREALTVAAADPEVGAVVLVGAQGYFCAGGDLNQLAKRRELTESQRRERIEALHETVRAIRRCPKPVLAAVEGGAAGAGVSLALACDLLVMAEDAYLSLAYVKVGLSPDGGATAFLAEFMPRQLLAELVLTGDRIAAPRLASLGVVNRVAAPGSAEAQAIELAQRLARGPQRAMARIKALSLSAHHHSVEAQLDAEAERMAASLGDAEAAEGIGAFFGKRAADFISLRKLS